MIVVSDTTPLRHLIAIGKVDLLRKVYGAVVVPTAVWSELKAESTPAAVKSWLQNAPDWLQVREPLRVLALGLGLPVTGTLGLLERADILGLLPDLPATLADLEASGFYLSARLRESVLDRYRRRHGTGS